MDIKELEANLEGVSPEVAEKYKAEVEALKGEDKGAADQTPPATPDPEPAPEPAKPDHAATSVPPTATGEPAADDDLSKQFPDGRVPVAALVAERKKRQELEDKLRAVPPVVAQPAPGQVQPAFDVNSKEFNRASMQQAVKLWEQDNPNEEFDAADPVHMDEVIAIKNQIKTAYVQYHENQKKAEAHQETLKTNDQRTQVELIQPMQIAYGVHYPAIENIAKQMLQADPKEMYYVLGSVANGDYKPAYEVFQKAAEQYKKGLQPTPAVKTEADKVDDISKLPRSQLLPTGDKGTIRTMADVDKMISDGSWAKLPQIEREAIINQIGGGAIN